MFSLFLQHWWKYLIVMVVCYCIGTINFSIIFSRAFKNQDIRKHGSGNAGTTNMFRVYGLYLGLATFVCDSLKGVLCCLVTKWCAGNLQYDVSMQMMYLAGMSCVMGHIYPFYYKFKGGKGVATSVGVCFATQPILSLCLVLPLVAIIIATDRMSIMSLVFALFMIAWSWIVLLPQITAFSCLAITLMFCSLIFAHRHNIKRLVTGKELPMGIRKAFIGKSKTRETNENDDN